MLDTLGKVMPPAAPNETTYDAGRYLRRALDAGRLARPKRGVYTPVRSVRSVRSGMESGYETDTPDTTDTTPREDDDD